MKTLVSMFSAVLIVLGIASAAPAAPGPCPDAGGTQYLVDTPAEAATLAGGYANDDCDLVVTSVEVVPSVQVWQAKARTVTLSGAQIINQAAFGKVELLTIGEIRVVAGSVVKARESIVLRCSGVLCPVTVLDSVWLSTSTLDIYNVPGDPTSGYAPRGNYNIDAKGPVLLERSTIWAGAGKHFSSQFSSFTWWCPSGSPGACTDPTVSPFVAATLCPNGYPCTVTFPDEAAVRAVCFPDLPGVVCGGSATEVRITALGDIDIRGSKFTFLNHVTFTSTAGAILAGPRNGSPLVIAVATDLILNAETVVDLTRAQVDAGGTFRVNVGAGCPAGATCVTAQQADVFAQRNILVLTQGGSGKIDLCASFWDRGLPGFPRFNSGLVPPYPASVRESAAECAPLAAAVIQ